MVDQSPIPSFSASTVPRQDAATLERLHTWIKPTKYEGDGSELEKHASSHLEGTGQWLFDSPVFQQWHDGSEHGILWIRGVPGAGKSVLAAKLVRHLTLGKYPVFHFFFRHSIESNHRPESALRDWIAQSLPSSPALQLELKNLALEHKDVASVDRLTVTDLWHLLKLALRSIPRAYFVVDALDEMDQDVFQDFLHLLDQLGNSNSGRVKLIITSRPIPLIERTVRNIKVLDIRLNNDQVSPDILKYLRHRVDGVFPTLGNHEAIVSKVLEKADGVFLYAKLAMDTLCEQEIASHQQMLDVIDKSLLNLSMMYGNLIREHMDRTGLPEGLNILVLQLVTHASRPLRLLEISDGIKVIRPEYTQDIATMKNIVRTSCGPLLEVLPDETVRVVHHSLTEYLLGLNRSPSDKDIPVFEPAHTHNVVALLCLSYLQAGCLDTPEYDRQKQWKNPQISPFMSYAATNWHVHIAKSSAQGFPQDEANEAIFSLLMTPQNSKKLALLLRSEASDDKLFWEELSSFVNQEEGKALLIALHLDLSSFARYLADRINMKTAGDIGSSRLHPPLHKAIIRGNLDMVRLLISKGVSISHYNTRGFTALHEALRVESISYAIVKYLLDVGADPWQRERNSDENPLDVTFEGKNHIIDDEDVQLLASNPPIESAFSYGDEQVVGLFLAHIKSEKAARYAFLRVLTNSKRPEVMRMIVNLGIMDLNSPIFGDTLLFTACIHLVPDAVKLLLDAGADPNFPRDQIRINPIGITTEGGANVLHGLAAPAKYGGVRREIPEDRLDACFALVFAAGANVTQVDDEGMTPLHRAMTPLAAKLLLDAGADPFALDNNGLTPLHVAYSVDVAEVLLAKTDINTRRHNGRTVLLQTLYKEDYRMTPTDDRSKLEMALNLLDLGVDPRISDSDGNGPLHYLMKIGVEHKPDATRLLERLVQAGVDINLRNNRGQTALHTVNYRDYIWAGIDSFKPLLALPAVDVNAADENGYTFLFNAVSLSGNIIKHEFVDLMVQEGAHFNVTDIRGRTLLHVFLKHIRSDIGPDDEMLKLLVEKGADPMQTDREGNTLWHEAARSFSGNRLVWPKVFHTITTLGVDPKQRNNRGKTPLHVMCEHDQEALRDWYPDPSKGNPTLFQYIVQQNHDGINEPDDDGIVPLHTLSTFSTDLTERLLDAGADATLATREGLNVFHLASRGRQGNVIGVIIDWFKAKRNTEQLVAAVNAKDERGRGPLYYACASGRYQSVELLIKAGAVPVLETYENSALQGLVEFEEELKNWRNGTDHPGAGAVHIDGTARPARHWSERRRQSYHKDRIDDILNLFINTATSSNWQGIDHAIIAAANRQHDYTVESLLRARMSLGLLAPPPSPPEVQACLQRRAKLLDSTLTTRHANHDFSSQVEFMIAERLYDAIPSYIQDYSPKPKSAYFYKVLLELSIGGYASLLDELLTPEVSSDLEKNTESMEEGRVKEESQDLSSLLAAACMSKQPNLQVIKLLMQKGAKADKIVVGPGHSTTALHVLVENRQHRWWQTEQALPYILERGVDLEVRINGGSTPLSLSLEHQERPSWRVLATEMLLQAGANPSSVDEKGKSCLAHAVGHDSAFQLLLRYGADLDPSTLASAILAKDVKTIEMMLASGADPNSRKVGSEQSHGETGFYPLDLLITSKGCDDQDAVCLRIIDLLFQHGADPNGRYSKTSVAHRVLARCEASGDFPRAKRNHYVHAIIEHPRLDINLQDAAGVPLLHVAYKAGDMKSTKVLIKRGADIRVRDGSGRNILHLSPDHKLQGFDPHMQLQLFDMLVTSAPELIHQVDKDGRTPLHCAISRRASKEEIELLISRGADVHAKDASGDTALHLLFREEWTLTVNGEYVILDERKVHVINHLVSKGLDVNVRNKAGETAVFSYLREGTLRVRTSQGEEVRDMEGALRRQNFNMEDSITLEKEQALWALFYELGVDWTIFNNERQSLMHIVAAKRVSDEDLKWTRLRTFEYLMGKGLDALAEDINGQTALDIAAAVGAEDILAHFKAD
ncbi:uncharacterized protein FIESC28_02673 [Fusarium coffeatum]|uniref:NACHT domain-containing protein n=1 Tax=Fusarium coffeatum TaxID=231269 RepID=A0A366S557_9HYPO|nr:uncharacterized protein FIESC28_02673 [Fusarium coffeatum]RBR24477.1 hypothetical protein FIESC28_02673 [Fusarium coffeatum]